MAKFKVKLLVSYDGSVHSGWQKQPNDPMTVQERLEKALSKIFNQEIRVVGSGRTDAGVHAIAQVAHFNVEFLDGKTPHDYKLVFALRGMLKPSIVVKRAWVAPSEFHAQRSAVSKTYKYLLLHRANPSAIFHRHVHWVPKTKTMRLDLDQLNSYASVFLGEHDFSSFRNRGSDSKTSVRTVFSSEWTAKRGGILEYQVSGSGFLKQMVRNLVGIQLHACLKGWQPEDVRQVMLAKTRSHPGAVAPAQGLYLKTVEYPPELDNSCLQL